MDWTFPRVVARMAREAAVAVRIQKRLRRTFFVAAGAILLAPPFVGCAGTVDRITSQRFRDKPFHTLFYTDDPLDVLRNVPEGDDRAKAMLAIKEPKLAGRSEAEQNEVVEILAKSATSDKHSICRLNAIEALSHFEDPRAASILVTAYRNAGKEAPVEALKETEQGIVLAGGRRNRSAFAPVPTVTPDQVATIQCRALESMGRKRSPEGLALLCEVAAKTVKKEVKAVEFDPLALGNIGQDQFDLQLAALTALENYKGDPQAIRTLYRIMTTDRDVAPKSCAYKSLVKVTGKDWPPESPNWATIVPAGEIPTATPRSP